MNTDYMKKYNSSKNVFSEKGLAFYINLMLFVISMIDFH